MRLIALLGLAASLLSACDPTSLRIEEAYAARGKLRGDRRSREGVATSDPQFFFAGGSQRLGISMLGNSQAGGIGTALSVAQAESNQRATGSLIALVETDPTGETPLSGICNQFATENDTVCFNRYSSGANLEDLDSGSTQYIQTTDQATEADGDVGGGLYELNAIALLTGSSDVVNGITAASYLATLLRFQTDIQRDIQTATGQTTPVLVFTVQTSSWTTTDTTAVIPGAAWQGALSRPTRIFLVAPSYFVGYADNHHFNADGKLWMGQQIGKVMDATLLGLMAYADGVGLPRLNWLPLGPASVTASGSVVTVLVDVPCRRYATPRCSATPPIVLDTTLVVAATNSGFRYIDTGGGTPPTISSVAIPACAAPATQCAINITMSAAPRDGSSIGYADYATGGDGCNSANGCPARGNVRDNDNTTAESAAHNMGNWLIEFTLPITSGTVPITMDGTSAGVASQTGAITGAGALAGAVAGVATQTGAVANLGIPTLTNTYSVSMSGANYMSIVDHAALNFGQHMTMCSWMRETTLGANRNLIAQYGAGGNSYILKSNDTVASDELYVLATSTSNTAITNAANLTTATWYHICAVFDGTQAAEGDRWALYVNGSASADTNAGTTPTTLVDSTQQITWGFTSASMAGYADELAFWNTSLTAANLLDIYNARTAGNVPDLEHASCPGNASLVLWCRGGDDDGGAGTSCTDRVAGTHTGTLQASAVFSNAQAP